MSPAIKTAGLASIEEPASAPPVRVPRLTYRNRSDPSASDQIPSMPGISSGSGQRINLASNADDEITVAPPKAAPIRTATRQIDWAVQPTNQKKASPELAPTPLASSDKKAKKRGSSFFNFLAVKEPTSGALEQYAQLQKRQAAEKGTAFMAGTSSQKLPAEVPKVNTRWDGLPQSSKPDSKRPGTVSSTGLHVGRRNSIATTNSSSKLSRRSHKSDAASSVELEFAPPPSLESLSIKPNPRHDSGTGVYEPMRPSRVRDSTAFICQPSAQMSGAPIPSERPQSTSSCGGTIPAPTSAIEFGLSRSKTTTACPRQNSTKVPSKTLKEIAPWAEPTESSDPWPPHPGSAGADDLDFITASPLEATPSMSIADQIAEAERKTASLSMGSRRPPSSNAQALAQLEPTGDKENVREVERKKSKQRKVKNKFLMFSGKS